MFFVDYLCLVVFRFYRRSVSGAAVTAAVPALKTLSSVFSAVRSAIGTIAFFQISETGAENYDTRDHQRPARQHRAGNGYYA